METRITALRQKIVSSANLEENDNYNYVKEDLLDFEDSEEHSDSERCSPSRKRAKRSTSPYKIFNGGQNLRNENLRTLSQITSKPKEKVLLKPFRLE